MFLRSMNAKVGRIGVFSPGAWTNPHGLPPLRSGRPRILFSPAVGLASRLFSPRSTYSGGMLGHKQILNATEPRKLSVDRKGRKEGRCTEQCTCRCPMGTIRSHPLRDHSIHRRGGVLKNLGAIHAKQPSTRSAEDRSSGSKNLTMDLVIDSSKSSSFARYMLRRHGPSTMARVVGFRGPRFHDADHPCLPLSSRSLCSAEMHRGSSP